MHHHIDPKLILLAIGVMFVLCAKYIGGQYRGRGY
jgi:hypothetical protein